MKMGEKQTEGEEGTRRLATSPFDVADIDLNMSTDEIVQFAAEGRRSRPPIIANAITSQPIPALSAEESVGMEVDEDLDRCIQNCQG